MNTTTEKSGNPTPSPAPSSIAKNRFLGTASELGSIAFRGVALSVLLVGHLFTPRGVKESKSKKPRRSQRESKLDDTIDQSFPASDPPAHY